MAVADGGPRFVGDGGPAPRRERALVPEGVGDMPAFGGLVARGEEGVTDEEERTAGARGRDTLGREDREGR